MFTFENISVRRTHVRTHIPELTDENTHLDANTHS